MVLTNGRIVSTNEYFPCGSAARDGSQITCELWRVPRSTCQIPHADVCAQGLSCPAWAGDGGRVDHIVRSLPSPTQSLMCLVRLLGMNPSGRFSRRANRFWLCIWASLMLSSVALALFFLPWRDARVSLVMIPVSVMMAAQFGAALAWDSKRDAANWLRVVSAFATLPLCMVRPVPGSLGCSRRCGDVGGDRAISLYGGASQGAILGLILFL